MSGEYLFENPNIMGGPCEPLSLEDKLRWDAQVKATKAGEPIVQGVVERPDKKEPIMVDEPCELDPFMAEHLQKLMQRKA